MNPRLPAAFFMVIVSLIGAASCQHEPCAAFPRADEGRAVGRADSSPAPRCAPDDLACRPIPAASFHGCYRPASPRRALFSIEATDPIDCAADGDCVLGGCGTACVSYLTPPMTSTCVLPGWMTGDLLCG